MKNIPEDRQIELLQDNLQALRKIAGWSADELGDRIGITKQSISNLENRKTRMSKTQYIAIRAVLDYEVQNNPENEILPKAINLLLDEGSNLSSEEYKEVKKSIEIVATAASSGADEDTVKGLFSQIVTSSVLGSGLALFTPITPVGGIIGGIWLGQLLGGYKEKKRSKIKQQEGNENEQNK